MTVHNMILILARRNEMSLGIRLLKYCLRREVAILSVLFYVLGFLFIFINASDSTFSTTVLSGVYFVIPLLIIGSSPMNATAASFVAASPYKRKIQTSVTSAVTVVFGMIGFTVYIVVRFISNMIIDGINIFDGQIRESESAAILITGIFAAVMLIIMIMSFKKYVISIILAVGVLVPCILAISMNGLFNWFDFGIDIWLTIIFGYGSIILGGAITFLISLLTYKSDLAKTNYKNLFSRRG